MTAKRFPTLPVVLVAVPLVAIGFAVAFAGTAQPETGFEASIATLALAEAAARSVAAGGPIRL